MDYFDISAPWYWVLQVTTSLYGLGIFAFLVLIQNNGVIDTFFKTLPGGVYYSLRYTSFQWVVLMFTSFKVFIYPIVGCMILFRRSKGCTFLWFTLFVIVMLVNVFTFVGLAKIYSSCNTVDAVDNICNDPLWCCVTAIYSVSTNGCHNTGPCAGSTVTSFDELVPDADFMWTFYTSLVFLLGDFFFLAFFSGTLGTFNDPYVPKHAKVTKNNNNNFAVEPPQPQEKMRKDE